MVKKVFSVLFCNGCFSFICPTKLDTAPKWVQTKFKTTTYIIKNYGAVPTVISE